MDSTSGIRTRTMLVAPLVLVIAIVTGSSLLIVRSRVREQVAESLAEDLNHSVETFQNLQRERREALTRENKLLADLPSLKALMTTRDPRTIDDGSVEFWKVSGNDLFALAAQDGRILTTHTQDGASTELKNKLQELVSTPAKHFLLDRDRLFEFSVQPLYFGSPASGTLLGYVISGYAIDQGFVQQISQAAAADAMFAAGDRLIVSTLDPKRQKDLDVRSAVRRATRTTAVELSLSGDRYLVATEDLSGGAQPLRLLVLKSFDQANRATRQINRLVALVGLLAIISGAALMLVLSDLVTRPLEMLAAGVRAFGFGDSVHCLPNNGTREVRELSSAFERMRKETLDASRALLESERLATIGRMASSVSHDLRHYLAAVYANAEFLSSPKLSDEERAELFADIRLAVLGTTELIDSLLIFSRTGGEPHRAWESVSVLLDKAVSLARAHPEAEGVTISVGREPLSEATEMFMDPKKVERAIYNLLLNACQSARLSSGKHEVRASVLSTDIEVSILIVDTGPGVPVQIRESLFEPFVSEGKHSGTGLGLTLAHCIAEEHAGSVALVSSRPGETVFRISLPRATTQEHFASSAPGRQEVASSKPISAPTNL